MRHTLAFEGPRHGSDAESSVHRGVVVLSPEEARGPARLMIGGVATDYDVTLNGTPVASGRSMWQRHDVAVDGLLRDGENVVEIHVHPLPLDQVPSRPRARWRTALVDEHRLRWVRTSIVGRAPGFSPNWPEQGPVVGPWAPVELVTGASPRAGQLRIRARVEGSVGVVEVSGPVSGADQVQVSAGGVEVAADVVDGAIAAVVRVPDVERWWPHTHGEPHLYDVLVSAGGTVLEQRRVGFRTLGNAAPESLSLLVNEVPIFVRGAVWTPGDLAALDQAVALGLNLVRVGGVMTYESEAFHARCDELGLMVWQDFMFATFDYPLADPEFVAGVRAEAVDQLARWLPHPSTTVICGSAEHEQQAAMAGRSFESEDGAVIPAGELAALLRPIVAESGIDALWVDSSPSGGAPPIRVDTGIVQYFGVGGYRRDVSDARRSAVPFASECLAFSNLPEGWPDSTTVGVQRDNGASWDFADVRRHYLHQTYGPDATDDQAARITGELMAAVFGEWRRAASPCGGGIVLWLRDLEPGAGWGLLDHEARPKPAALELAPVLQPTAVWLVEEGLSGIDVHIAHDPATPLPATLTVELLRADGTVADSATRELTLEPHSSLTVGVEELLGHWVDVAWAYRFGDRVYAAVRATLTAPGLTRTATWRAQESGSI